MQQTTELESIFAAAMQLGDPTQQADYLADACGPDTRLRLRVQALLAASRKAGDFLDEPASLLLSDVQDESESARCDHSEWDDAAEQPGDQLGNYHLQHKLGQGGMGCVYLAEQIQPVRREVALKIIRPGLDSHEVLARFDVERQALAMMSHPNIARVLDGGTTKHGRPYLVMELVRGVSITEFCRRQKLCLDERLRLFLSVCEAIQHAHQKGVIHRDIKPNNVMVAMENDQPVVKVIDFGIAKALDRPLNDGTIVTRFGEFIGTPAYMSPEQARPREVDIDTRSDVYSLGALLYEMVTGQAPFDAQRLQTAGHDELQRIIREETPPTPSAALSTRRFADTPVATPELRRAVHGELDWIVMRALEKDRVRRFPTAAALAEDIQRLLNHEVVQSRPASWSYQTRKWLRRHRTLAAACVLVASTMIVATAVSARWAWTAQEANQRATVAWGKERTARRQAQASAVAATKARDSAKASALAAEQARQQASDEAQSLTEVVQFLNRDLLAHASPLNQPDRHLQLRTVLDRAAAELAKQPQRFSRPSVEASVRATIGDTYFHLGLYQQAALHLGRVYELQAQRLGKSHRETVLAANRWNRARLRSAQPQAAADLVRDTYKSVSEWPRDDAERIQATNLLAQWHSLQGQTDQAVELLRPQWEHLQQLHGQGHPETWKAMSNLGAVYQAQGKHDEAYPLLHQAYTGITAEHGLWHPATLQVSSRFAGLLNQMGRLTEARTLSEDLQHRAVRLLGDAHEQTLRIQLGLALHYQRQGDLQLAEPLLRRVGDTATESLGPAHAVTLAAMRNLAMLLRDSGTETAASEAAELLLAEWQRRHHVWGWRHPATRDSLGQLAFLHMQMNDFAQASKRYQQLAQQLRQLPAEPQRRHDTAVAELLLAQCQLALDAGVDAKQILTKILSERPWQPTQPWFEFAAESLLGETLHSLGERDAAEQHLAVGLDGLQANEGTIPVSWQPLGVPAALQRLVEFYETAPEPAQRNQAGHYRSLLQQYRRAHERPAEEALTDPLLDISLSRGIEDGSQH